MYTCPDAPQAVNIPIPQAQGAVSHLGDGSTILQILSFAKREKMLSFRGSEEKQTFYLKGHHCVCFTAGKGTRFSRSGYQTSFSLRLESSLRISGVN